jgi:hypothetical protein
VGEDDPVAGQTATTTAVAARRFRPASPATALVLVGLVLALLAAAFPLGDLARQSVASGGAELGLGPVFGVVGFVVAWRRPGNPLGWLMLGAVDTPGGKPGGKVRAVTWELVSVQLC